MSFKTQPIVIGDTVDFTLYARKNGATWDITSGTVSLYLTDPSGNVSSPYSATISDGAAGLAHYQVATDVLDEAGDWYARWKVVKSGITMYSALLPFNVQD